MVLEHTVGLVSRTNKLVHRPNTIAQVPAGELMVGDTIHVTETMRHPTWPDRTPGLAQVRGKLTDPPRLLLSDASTLHWPIPLYPHEQMLLSLAILRADQLCTGYLVHAIDLGPSTGDGPTYAVVVQVRRGDPLLLMLGDPLTGGCWPRPMSPRRQIAVRATRPPSDTHWTVST